MSSRLPDLFHWISRYDRKRKKGKRIVTRGRYNQIVRNTQSIQERIDTLYIRYDNGDATHNEILQGLSFVVAKNIKSKILILCEVTFTLYVRYNLYLLNKICNNFINIISYSEILTFDIYPFFHPFD